MWNVLSLDLPRLSQLKNICCYCCCCAYCCSLHTRIDITGQGSRLRFSLLRRSLAKKVKAPPRGRSCSRQVASSGKLWFSVTLLLGYHHAYHVLVLTNCKKTCSRSRILLPLNKAFCDQGHATCIHSIQRLLM